MTHSNLRLVLGGLFAAALTVTCTFAQNEVHVPPHGPSLKGRHAQNFVLRDLSGKSVSLADYAGKPVVVNFWATWCPPCLMEMPWFEKLKRQYSRTGLSILGISTDIESNSATPDTIRARVERLHVTYPILLANRSIYASYGPVHLLPETFYISRSGMIVEDVWGHADEESIRRHISEIIK